MASDSDDDPQLAELRELQVKAHRMAQDYSQHGAVVDSMGDTLVEKYTKPRRAAAKAAYQDDDSDDDVDARRESVARKRVQTDRDVADLKAVQNTEDRYHPHSITLLSTHARELKEFFDTHGNEACVTPVNSAFMTTFLGTTMQTPGGMRGTPLADGGESEKNRLRAASEWMDAVSSVAQAALNSSARCIRSIESGGDVRVIPAGTYSVDDLQEQMICPLGPLKACTNGGRCVAMRDLPPHENGLRFVLKGMQNPTAFHAFRATGSLVSDCTMAQVLGPCLPCLLLTYAMRLRAAVECGEPCSSIPMPFSAVTGRAGGFARAVLFSDRTMSVAWPNLMAHHFVPVKKQISYKVGTRNVTEMVYGYEFRADVLFDASALYTGTDTREMLAMVNPPITTTAKTTQPAVPHVLARDISAALSVELSRSEDFGIAVKRLLTEFDATLRLIISADGTSSNWMRVKMSPYWTSAMEFVGAEHVGKLGRVADSDWSPHTHSVLAATMWRTGLARTLGTRSEINGNRNLNSFLSGHTDLQRWLFSTWMTLGHPPSDKELFGARAAVLTADSICAALHLDMRYPVYGQPRLSPSMLREVCTSYTHVMRASPMSAVREAFMPAELAAHDMLPWRASRESLSYLADRWMLERCEATDSVHLADIRSPFSFSRCKPRLSSKTVQWIEKAITVIALQEDIDQSVWLLGAVMERWPWFAFAAAACTAASASMRTTMRDRTAAHIIEEGHWVNTSPLAPIYTDVGPKIQIPHDAPAWAHGLAGPLRFMANYAVERRFVRDPHSILIEYVPLGTMMMPEMMYSHRPRPDYLVAGALRLRVYELQRRAAELDKSMHHAFAAHIASRKAEGRAASEPIEHPNRKFVDNVRRVFAGVPVRDILVPHDPPRDSVDYAHIIAQMWDDPTLAIDEALAVELTLVDKIHDAVLRPIMNGEVPLYADDKPLRMGVPAGTPRRELAYNIRCALFEHLELAHQMTTVADVSDAYWHATEEHQRRIDLYKPLANSSPCEDTLPDLTPYIGLDLLHESGGADFAEDSAARRSWIPQVASVMPKACFIRDFSDKHFKNCQNSEYVAWCAHAMLTSVLGTYRHAHATQDFNHALVFYSQLRPQNAMSEVAQFLVDNTFTALIAGREFQMFELMLAISSQRVLAAVWPNFPYVQQCWVPSQAEQLRAAAREQNTPALCEAEVHKIAVLPPGEANDVPRVFRHLAPAFSIGMLSLFSTIEIASQTANVVESTTDICSLPPIVNLIPPTIKHQMARYMTHTDPREPIRLEWFADLGVTRRGLAQIVMANALYVSQARQSLIEKVLQSMNRMDFFYAWTALHVMVLYRDSVVLPTTMEMATNQYGAAQYRANDMVSPPPPTFTHMRFCHLLGCAGPQSYYVPLVDPGHYGSHKDMFATNIGSMVCSRQKTAMYNQLGRHIRASQVPDIANSMNAIVAALDDAPDAAQRMMLQKDLTVRRGDLVSHQSKNVRATISVMMTLPCPDAPMQEFRIVGGLVVRRDQIPRGNPQVYTACPNCGMPTIYSIDRYGPNGFTCGMCDRLERTAIHGKWCFGCGACEPTSVLPPLTGEARAAARNARTQHQIQGSSIQAATLKMHQTRMRHGINVKLRSHAPSTEPPVDAGEQAPDTSDVLNAPIKSVATEQEAQRNARYAEKPMTPRRSNTADAYKLGRSLTEVHRLPVKLRLEPFHQCVVYDDRPGGLFTTMVVYMCGPCENLVRKPSVSASAVMAQITAEPSIIYIHGRRVSLNYRPGRGRGRGRGRKNL